MKRFSLVCCLVLLLNMFCPAVHVHAEEITTPSDLPCEHTEVVEMHDADYHWSECASCQAVIGSKSEHYGSIMWWDKENHWTGCRGCGEPTSNVIMPHASDCGDPTACTTCPYKGVKEEQMYHDIDWSNMVYQHDEKQHWYPCYCGETKDFVEDHVAYCGDPNTCGICGAALPAPMETEHKYTYEGSDGHDATYHWYNCELCGEMVLKEKHWNWCMLDPTLCDRCPDTTGLTIARMDHDIGLEEGVHDTATHETVCKYCETRVSQLSTAITVEATCTSTGSKTVTCSVCGVISTETIPSTGHNVTAWSSVDNVKHQGTCLECGETVEDYHDGSSIGYYDNENCLYQCSDCGVEYTGEHRYVTDPETNWFFDETYHYYMCSGCGEQVVKSKHYGAVCVDHTCMCCGAEYSYDPDDIKHWIPCNSIDGKCERCGQVPETDILITHTWGDPVIVEPTCTIGGCKKVTCTTCGAEETEVLPAVAHKWETVKNDEYTHSERCSGCGEVSYSDVHARDCQFDFCVSCYATDVVFDFVGHFHNANEDVHNTETHSGICKYCGEYSHLSTQTTIESTCTRDGEVVSTCRVCNEEIVETIPSTGHSYEWRSDATGYHWEFCTKCQLMQNYGEHYALCSAEDQSVCDLCGKTVDDGSMVLIHDYAGMPWEYDAEAHWQNCFCGEMYPDRWVHDVYCTDPDAECFCGYVGEVEWIQHNFNYNEATYIDADSHLVVCEDCGAEETYNHWSEDCLTDICIECGGAYESVNHLWPEQYEYDEDGHWFICEVCNETVNDDAHWYTCMAPDTCELCGYKTTGATDFYHYWTTTYEKDNAYYHYKKCPECGEDYEFYAHIVSCADPDVCLTCGATGVDMDNVNHGEIKWEHNDTEHWGVCTVCNEIMEEGKHWTDCSKPDLCQDCGAKNVTIDPDVLSHFDVEWGSYEKDATHHWYTCRSCNVKAFYEEHYVSCTEKGICSACGIAGEFEVSHDVLKPGWESDATNHWKVCAVCNEAAKKIAHFDTDNDGKCDACQVSVAHVHTWGEPVIVAATCTTDGSKTTACSTCGEKTVETIKAAGHVWGETVIVDATCAADGSKTTACTACGEETVEVIPAHDQHTWKTVANAAATCTKQGRVEKVCTVCDETSIVNPAAKGHSYGLVFTTQGNGTHAKTCADCGAKRAEDCTLTSTEVGSMTCSACATCGYTVYTMNDAALENAEDVENAEELADAKAETTVKRVENVSFEMVPVAAEEATEAEAETAAEPVDYSDVVLVVHETVVEMKVELPDTVNAEVKKVLAVSLLKEGVSIQPSSKVKLSIPVVEEEVSGLKLVLMTETGELIELEYEIIDGVMVFETEMVGVFLFVDAVE